MDTNNNFIVAIQSAYNEYSYTNNTDNKLRYYNNVSIAINDINEANFEIKHFKELRTGNHRTQFLYCRGGVRVYFSDADIIMMLLQIEDSDKQCKVLNAMHEWIKGSTECGVLTIDGIDYSFSGIYWKSDDGLFETRQDVVVLEKDLISLINLIIAKDAAATSINLAEGYDFAMRTVKKYYTLLKWYWYKDQHAKEQLDLIGYNTSLTIRDNYKDNKRREWKKMDLAFQKVAID